MDKSNDLTLAEKLLLLAYDDERGDVVLPAAQALPYGLAGALILDLLHRDIITIENHKIALRDHTATGNALLDEVIELLAEPDNPRSIKYWISRICAKINRLPEHVAGALVDKGILRDDHQQVLRIFHRHRFPMIDDHAENAIRRKIRNAVLQNLTPDAETAALIALVKACNLVEEIFALPERTLARQRIRLMTAHDAVSNAVKENLQTTIIVTVSGAISATT